MLISSLAKSLENLEEKEGLHVSQIKKSCCIISSDLLSTVFAPLKIMPTLLQGVTVKIDANFGDWQTIFQLNLKHIVNPKENQ